MDRTVERRIASHRAEDLARLADKAERGGVVVFLTADGAHFATSRSNPTLLHRVGVDGCDCRGWQVWRRCGHHALLLAELGHIPGVDAGEPEPEPVAAIGSDSTNKGAAGTFMPSPTARCPSCNGRGFYFVAVEGVSRPVSRTCSPCHGVGRAKVGVVAGERVLRPVA